MTHPYHDYDNCLSIRSVRIDLIIHHSRKGEEYGCGSSITNVTSHLSVLNTSNDKSKTSDIKNTLLNTMEDPGHELNNLNETAKLKVAENLNEIVALKTQLIDTSHSIDEKLNTLEQIINVMKNTPTYMSGASTTFSLLYSVMELKDMGAIAKIAAESVTTGIKNKSLNEAIVKFQFELGIFVAQKTAAVAADALINSANNVPDSLGVKNIIPGNFL